MADGTTPNTKIHRDQGGAMETYEAGAILNFKAGAVFLIDGVDVALADLGDDLVALEAITAAGWALLDDASAAAQLVTLGVNATAAEVNARCDDSAMLENVVAAGALSVTVAASTLAVVSGGAVTLAAPSKPAMQKIIKMTVDDGDVTLALTNVVGGTQATTATFSAVGQTLVLISDVASGKWLVLKEQGVVLS